MLKYSDITEPVFNVYWILGVISASTNAVLIIYHLFHMQRNGWRMIILACSQFTQGLTFIISGFTQTSMVFDLNMELEDKIWRSSCARNVVPALNALGAQWSAIVITMMGIEKFIAVMFPLRYYKIKPNTKDLPMFMSPLLAAASVITGVLLGLFVVPDSYDYYVCTLSTAYGNEYGGFHYLFTIGGYVTGFACSSFSLFHALRSPAFANKRSDIVRHKAIVFMTLFSLLLVCTPNALLYSLRFLYANEVLAVLSAYTNCLFCVRSSMDIFISTYYDQDFRKSVIYVITFGRVSSKKSSKICVTTPSTNTKKGTGSGCTFQ